jgi:hypothetical protein
LEKAKLTKQQAEALEKAREYNLREIIVEQKVLNKIGESFIKEMPLDTLIRALYIGYEVEQTEQEKIQEIWKANDSEYITLYKFKYRSGIERTLKALGREDLIPEEEN